MKNLVTRTKLNERFRSDDTVERVQLEVLELLAEQREVEKQPAGRIFSADLERIDAVSDSIDVDLWAESASR